MVSLWSMSGNEQRDRGRSFRAKQLEQIILRGEHAASPNSDLYHAVAEKPQLLQIAGGRDFEGVLHGIVRRWILEGTPNWASRSRCSQGLQALEAWSEARLRRRHFHIQYGSVRARS